MMIRRMVLKEMHDHMAHAHHKHRHHDEEHDDHEGRVFHHNGAEAESDMIHSNLWTLKTQACDLYDMIGDRDDLPEWVQEKIAVAGSMLDSVYDYLHYEYHGEEEDRHVHSDRIASFETGHNFASDADVYVAHLNEKAARRGRRRRV